MRTFGMWLAIIGAVLGLMVGIFGWLMLIIGLLMMIAAPKAVRVDQAKPSSRQSTGGYAGLANKTPHSEFDLGNGPGRKQVRDKLPDPWGNRKLMKK